MIPEPSISAGIKRSERDPVVVLAADEAFAMPLAVTIRSALEHLGKDRTLQIYVLDGGITPATKERIVRSWQFPGRYSLHWVSVDESALNGLEVSGHVSIAAYFRMLMPRILPAEVRRVLYLDSDLLVLHDLGALWDQDLADKICLAGQDFFAPYIDASVALPPAHRALQLITKRPVQNYQALGISPELPYLNSGVMLFDLVACRKLDLTTQLIQCLQENREHVKWWDQYALNVVLAGQWSVLDPRWNQGAFLYKFPDWSYSHLDKQAFQSALNDPYIVHFSSPEKPWHANSRHPYLREFFQYLDRTDWAGWRPADDKTWAYWWKMQKGAASLAYKNFLLRLRAR
jgi:lipopolysaccharide biosynthesis glycosyltransferase